MLASRWVKLSYALAMFFVAVRRTGNPNLSGFFYEIFLMLTRVRNNLVSRECAKNNAFGEVLPDEKHFRIFCSLVNVFVFQYCLLLYPNPNFLSISLFLRFSKCLERLWSQEIISREWNLHSHFGVFNLAWLLFYFPTSEFCDWTYKA